MRRLRDAGRTPIPRWAGVAVLISALTVLVAVPESAATTSGTSHTLSSDALYQPVAFGNLPNFDTSNVAYDFPVVGTAATPDGGGYWLVASDGGVFTFGNAAFYGSAAPLRLNQPIVGMASTPDGKGYWLVAADGGVFAFGDATYFGSMGNRDLNKPVVGMAATPGGGGYWLAGADGGVFSFGDAMYYGNSVGLTSGAGGTTTVGISSDPRGGGYWLVSANGVVAAFGDAPSHGSAAGVHLNAPVVGMASTPDGGGYWEVASDGGVFTFGDAQFYGSLGGQQITYPIGGIAIDTDGSGYWLLPITTLPTATLGAWTGIEPTLMQFSGDAGNIVSNIDWSSWNDHSAVGEGAWGYDDCIPDCAQGPVKDYPATIALSNPSDGRFTLLTEDQSGPFGQTFTFALPGPAFRASS
jgi:hypothetical protein